MSKNLKDNHYINTHSTRAAKPHTRAAELVLPIRINRGYINTVSDHWRQSLHDKEDEVKDAPNIVTGNFSMKTHPIEVLFDF